MKMPSFDKQRHFLWKGPGQALSLFGGGMYLPSPTTLFELRRDLSS